MTSATENNSTSKNEIIETTIEKKHKNMSDLEFVRLKIPRLIPVELIENVKGRTFTPQQFIEYQERNVDNPNNFLYVLIDKSKKIHGYLWAEMNSMDQSLFVNTFSIDKQYWGKGQGIDSAVEFISQLQKKTKSPRVFWCSTNEKFFAKKGFRRSKVVLMEYVVPGDEQALSA